MAGAALEAAKERLTVWDVWRASGRAYEHARGCAGWGCDGLHNSPIRGERTPSFSVRDDGRKWKDFGGGDDSRGSVWDLVVALYELREDGAVAAKLIELAGTGDLDTADRELSDRERRRMAREREVERAAYRSAAVRRAWDWPAVDAELVEWPDCVRERWNGGRRAVRGVKKPFARVCDWRGWPVELASAVFDAGVLAYPKWPRQVDDDSADGRSPAFRVSVPDGSGGLRHLGYHQAFYIKSAKGRIWNYFPNLPREDGAAASEFLAELARLGQRTPAAPFVVGDVGAPRVVAILEGQWDAATYHWVEGGFDAGSGRMTLGCRGVHSWRLALALWREQLQGAERVELVPDVDEAGDAWTQRSRSGGVEMPCLRDVLETGCGSVVVKRIPSGLTLNDGTRVKDYNDFYVYQREESEL